MRVIERTGDFPRDAHRVGNRQLVLAFEACSQRLTGNHGHHVVEQAVGITAVEQRQDVRVLQPRRRLDFGEEAIAAECSTEIGVQHLDGDVAVVLEIMREIHGGHPAGAELAVDAIAVGEGQVQACDDVRVHGAAELGIRATGGQPNRGPNACTRGKARSVGPKAP